MRRFAGLPVFVSVFIVTILAGQAAVAQSVSHWNGLAATDFTQCYTRAACAGAAPCQSDELRLDAPCEAECHSSRPGQPPYGQGGYGCQCSLTARIDWYLAGNSGYSSGDIGFVTATAVQGRLLTATEFELVGYVDRFAGAELPTQLALFVFDGDPTVFDGVEAWSIYDLVAEGLIAESDILWSRVYSGLDGDLEEVIDITGVDASRLVLFGASIGSVPIPAVSTWGVFVLAGLILLLAPFALRLGRRAG